MRNILLTFLFLTGNLAFGQHFFMTTFLGVAAYQGDIQPKPLAFLQSKPVAGIGFDYQIIPHLDVKMEYSVARIGANDKYNLSTKSRNLSFKSDIYDLSFLAEYYLLDLDKYPVSPFLFGGISYFKFSPFVDLPNGLRVFLPDMDTEGQTFYLDRKKYDLSLWTATYGAGVMWAISNRLRLGYSIGFRKPDTDYLDDVSTTYVDRDELQQRRGNTAVALAYRGDQLPNGAPYPAAGTQRGNPFNNDSYYFMGLTMRFTINPKGRKPSDTPPKVPKSRVSCPRPVF